MIRRFFLASIAALLLLAPPATAHPLDESRADVVVAGARVRWLLSVHRSFLAGLDSDRDGMIAPGEVHANLPSLTKFFGDRLYVNAGGRLCTPRVEGVAGSPDPERVAIGIEYRCPAPIKALRIEMHLFDGITPNWVSLVKLRWAGSEREFAFREGSAAWEVGGAEAGGTGLAAQAGSFLALGVEHIFTGYDHLMFLVGLLLLGGRFRSLVKIVTAFTIAHSATLVLAALGVVDLPSRVVEPAIALSIAYVGAENFFLKSVDRRWIIAFFFGLIHGFGFAGILRQLGLPEQGLILSLLSFNVGVEVRTAGSCGGGAAARRPSAAAALAPLRGSGPLAGNSGLRHLLVLRARLNGDAHHSRPSPITLRVIENGERPHLPLYERMAVTLRTAMSRGAEGKRPRRMVAMAEMRSAAAQAVEGARARRSAPGSLR